jgi:ribosomal protein S18 acetylase RimI-like enzyme
MTACVRVLSAGDDAVLEHVADVFDDPIDAQAAATFLRDPRHHIAVAIDQGVVVGFASGVHYLHPDKPRPELFINEVGVAESHRGQGIGKAVLNALLARGKALGCGQAWVLTDRDNVAAMRLYAAGGGSEPGHDQVMFTFELEPSE